MARISAAQKCNEIPDNLNNHKGDVKKMAKRYKLLKDLPTVKTGAIFHRDTNETMQVDMLKRVDDQGIFLPPSFDVSSVHNFNEWFEEVKQLTINDIDWNFDPKPGDICYCVDNAGNILSWTHAAEDEKAEVAMGNCLRTEQEAEAYKRWLKAVAELRCSSDFKPRWDISTQPKYYIACYTGGYSAGRLIIRTTYDIDYCLPTYYRTKEEAKQSIKDHKEAWLTYFGVIEDD